jgi:adenylate cyclase
MLRDLLGADPSVAGLAGQIGRRTAGNPFFMEEAVRSLVDAGNLSGTRGAHRLARPVDEIAIPTTVQAVLAARIDRLPEDLKRLLQDAAVIGKEFPERLLRKIAAIRDEAIEPALQALAEAEFIHATSLYPEAEYAFNHPLTQEVAYRSRLAEPRERVHAALARAIEELHPDKLDEKAALLAHHWEAAGDKLEAARWSCRAALWTGLRDIPEAARHWRKVRELTDASPEMLETLYLGRTARAQILSLGLRIGLEEGEADALYREGRSLASKPTDHPSGDKRFLALLLAAYSGVKGLSGDVRAATAVSEEAFQLAAELEDPGLMLDLAVGLVYVYTNVGRFEEARQIAERALAGSAANPGLGSGVLGFNSYCWLIWYRAVILVDLGRFDEAAKGLDEALQLAREQGELEIRAWIHGTMSYLARFRGDIAGALQNGRAAVELAERIGSPLSIAVSLWPLGQAHLEAGDAARAAEILEQGIAVAREKRTGLQIEPSLVVHLAEARMELGDLVEARALAERALETSQRQGYFWEADADVILARVLMRAEGADAASRIEALLERAQTLVTNSGARSRDPMLRLQRAELARLRGDEAARRTALREARAMFAELGAEAQAVRVDALLGKG